MNRLPTTLLPLLLAGPSACMDVPEYQRDPGVAEGEGEGEGPAEGEGEGEGEGAAEGEGEGPAEGEGEGPAEGEGEGPAEGEGEGPAEGEGEGEGPPPAPPHVERLVDDLIIDANISGAEFTADERELGVYRPFGTVALHALDGSGRLRRVRVDDAPQNALFEGFALSPVLPLAVTMSSSGDIQAWSIEGDAPPEYLAAWTPETGYRSRMRFDSDGDMVVVLAKGNAVVVRVAGGVSDVFTEPGLPEHPGQQAVFVGPDDTIVVLENPETARLRVRPTQPDGTGMAARWRTPAECDGITAVSGARQVNLLAYLCSDGTVWLAEVVPAWGDARPFRGSMGPLESVELSPDGRLLAALEDERLHVFDTETGGRATVEVGAGDDHYGRGAAFSPGSRMLALDRDRRAVVLSVRPAGEDE